MNRVLEALRKQRQHTVEIAPGLSVTFRRPLEAEMPEFSRANIVDSVCKYVVGWQGFTEATLLGDAVGASDPVDFDVELWAAYVRDDLAKVSTVADAIADTMRAHLAARGAAEKN